MSYRRCLFQWSECRNCSSAWPRTVYKGVLQNRIPPTKVIETDQLSWNRSLCRYFISIWFNKLNNMTLILHCSYDKTILGVGILKLGDWFRGWQKWWVNLNDNYNSHRSYSLLLFPSPTTADRPTSVFTNYHYRSAGDWWFCWWRHTAISSYSMLTSPVFLTPRRVPPSVSF